MDGENVATYWNGQPCAAYKCLLTVGDDPSVPHYWAKTEGLIGQQIKAVKVVYGDSVFYLDDRDGSGWNKVTHGRGSPRFGHRQLDCTTVTNVIGRKAVR